MGPSSAAQSLDVGKVFTSLGLALFRTLSGFWTGNMKNPFLVTAGDGAGMPPIAAN
jgi:hypothetical protein